MKTVIKVLQVLLGLWSIMGASYMMQNYTDLSSEWAAKQLPSLFWQALAIIQIIAGLILTISLTEKTKKYAKVTSSILCYIFLSGVFLYSEYDGFPGILWAVIPALLLGYISFYYKKK